jgi:hypothetical protein
MCWGKDDPPEMQAIPNPPPEKEMMDFVSYIRVLRLQMPMAKRGVLRHAYQGLPKIRKLCKLDKIC